MEYNDAWYDAFKEKYYTICERSDEVLENQSKSKDKASTDGEGSKVDVAAEPKLVQERKQAEFMCSQIESEHKDIEEAINKLETEVMEAAFGISVQGLHIG